jgi:hypothetical protein
VSIVLFILAIWAFIAGMDAASIDPRHNPSGITPPICYLASVIFFVTGIVVIVMKKQKAGSETDPESSKLKIYYFSRNDTNSGPYTFNEMGNFLQKEMIGAETLVFREGDDEWHPLAHFKEFFPN